MTAIKNIVSTGNITGVEHIHATATGTGTAGFWGKDSGGTPRILLQLLNVDNDAHLFTSPANHNLKFSKDDFSADIMILNNSTGLTMQGTGSSSVVTANKLVITGASAQVTLLNSGISRLSTFAGTATGTYNHGLGATPTIVLPMQDVVGSQTMGYDTLTVTQVHITSGAGNSFNALCYHS